MKINDDFCRRKWVVRGGSVPWPPWSPNLTVIVTN